MTVDIRFRKLARRVIEKVFPRVALLSRYSGSARKCLFDAVRAADSSGAREVHREHLALGLLMSKGNGEARSVLELHGANVANLPTSTRASEEVTAPLPLSPAVKSVLSTAGQLSSSSGHQRVHCLHLLLALLKMDADGARSMFSARETLNSEAVEQFLFELRDGEEENLLGGMFIQLRNRRRRKDS